MRWRWWGSAALVFLATLLCTAGANAAFTVTITEPAPDAQGTATITRINYVSFNCEPHGATGYVTYHWDFGDGRQVNEQQQYMYFETSDQPYQVRVTALDHGDWSAPPVEAHADLSLYVIGSTWASGGGGWLRYYVIAGDIDTSLHANMAQPTGTAMVWESSPALQVADGQGTASPVIGPQAASGGPYPYGQEWVRLRCSRNGVTYTEEHPNDHWTVFQPTSAVRTDTSHTPLPGTVFTTQIFYVLLNQYGDTSAMGGVPFNEDFSGDPVFQSDWLGQPDENWPPGAPGGAVTDEAGVWHDNLWVADPIALTWWPPAWPYGEDPMGSRPVFHTTQTWRAGSQTHGRGCSFHTDVLRVYTDRGDHE